MLHGAVNIWLDDAPQALELLEGLAKNWNNKDYDEGSSILATNLAQLIRDRQACQNREIKEQ